jgi:hypothetical protein
MTSLSPTETAETRLIASALDALAATSGGTEGARERMMVALAASRLALCAPAAFDESVLCLDREVAESYSFEEASEKAGLRPRQDLLAAGLEEGPCAPARK